MSIEWDRLRSFNGSQNDAFEALICQLANCESVPVGSEFVRKGTPDAGLECFWICDSGDEYGWQAKFFTSPPSAQQWGQVDSSVSTALQKHPRLVQYTVCMATDRPDPRIPGQRSFLDGWMNHATKWTTWAVARGMKVDFRYWGTHEILERLSREEHAGRYVFWFNDELLTLPWFHRRLQEVVAQVGPRYTPELNLKLDISGLFEGLSRSPTFFSSLRDVYGDVGKAWAKAHLRVVEKRSPQKLAVLSRQVAELVDQSKRCERTGVNPIEWDRLERLAEKLEEQIAEVDSDLAKPEPSDTPKAQKVDRADRREDDVDYARYDLRRMERAVVDFREFVSSDTARLTNTAALLVVGNAGSGKTHLLCDAAKNHLKWGAPAIVLLGGEFRAEEPWSQMLRMLGLSCKRDEFLGALESAAQISGRRAIIMIDAINEGEGRTVWMTHLPAMLECIRKYRWISIVVSVRTSYEKTLIPEGLVPDKFVRAFHAGFAEREYEAAKAYFEFYGIQLPAVPLLSPEFQNPLFLRCFCRGLHNKGLSKIPAGIKGISSVFNFFLDSVNERLSGPDQLDFDVKSRIVGAATRKLAAALADGSAGAIPREEASRICEEILPNRGYEKSLFRGLLSEGVLVETVRYGDSPEPSEMIGFSYERLSDHLIMGYLIERYVDRSRPLEAFLPGQPLGDRFGSDEACWQNRGLADALAVQGPEVLGSEIFELIPSRADSRPVCEAFIESILWRDAKTISDRCLAFINDEILRDSDLDRRLLDVLIAVAPNPEHPFNADFLHNNLARRDLAQRDAWWSIFLFQEYGRRGSVDRLVDWAWSAADKSHVSEDAIRLAGKALVWFLSTSHRFLRDRATKALVCLFRERLDVLCILISDFREVNDPYVIERLYAVAYGCALRSNDPVSTGKLAQIVYDAVFRSGSPPVHILLRDYARGVIEVALRDGVGGLGLEVQKIRPPYRSEWPLVIPTPEELEAFGRWSKEMPDEEWALHSIYNSVLGSDDFSRYILGSDRGTLPWSKRLLGEPRSPSRKEQYEAFKGSLTARQKKAWNALESMKMAIEVLQRMAPSDREKVRGGDFGDDELAIAVQKTESGFRRTLGKRKETLYDTTIKAYVEAPFAEKDELALPVSIAQRWIFKRVLDLGWSVKLFGWFDRRCNRYDTHGRSADKPERVGKKYQWIAYHEFLAHLSDNLEFRGDGWSDEPTPYQGPWQLWLRDIDPSCSLIKTQRSQWEPNVASWWAPVAFDSWNAEPDPEKWRKRLDLLPDIAPLPIVQDPEDGKRWMVLGCFYNWEEAAPPERDRFEAPRKYVWYMLRSYLVKGEDESVFLDWAKEQHFMGRWMPESHGRSKVFLGEYFWAPAFNHSERDQGKGPDWTNGGQSSLPCEVLITTDEYMQERSGYDCSIDDTVSVYLPAKWIAGKMSLSWRGVDSCFFDPSGKLIAQDPSAKTPGPGALLVDEESFLAFLDSQKCRIVWTLLAEKDIHQGLGRNEDWPGRMELSACLHLGEKGIRGTGTAYWVTTGPKQEKIGQVQIGQ